MSKNLAQVIAAEKAVELNELNNRYKALLRKVPNSIEYNADGTQTYGYLHNNRAVFLKVYRSKIQDVLEY